MADISDVNINEIKDLYENLDSLSCKFFHVGFLASSSLIAFQLAL